MATLVLSSVGQAFGGPFGAALGSIIGRSVDEQLFGPGPRKGPRLNDLAVQTSSYGSAIPRVYGKMRIAGTVVWATDLIEEETSESTGKWSPGVVRYRYFANFAVALSSRPIRTVRRIWADGKLIRGEADDFKVQTEFRLWTGDEDQPVDPLIASEEGIAMAPAYRGVALAVFERLDLSEFGNRIPVLTFEVEADEGAVEPAFVLADASGGAIVANTASTPKLAGYAAHGSDRLSALRPIIETLDIALCDEAGKLVDAPDRQRILAEWELGCALGRDEHPAVEWSRQAEADAPRSVAIDFYDPGRDYQAGRVCVSAGAGGATDEQFELPVALAPEDAKSVATNLIARRWAEAETLTLRLPPTRMGIAPGTELVLSDRGRWRVQAVTIEGFAVVVEARRAVASLPTVPVDGGRQVFQADIAVARTRLGLFEVPQVDGHNRLMVAASSAGGFKPVPIELRVDGVQIGAVSATRAARLGRSAEYLAASSTPDDTMVVELVNPAQILFNADAQALAVGANRAMLGREMIQFATAEDLGFGRFRLGGFVRGCRGTQWAVAAHEVGTPFCLVDGLAMVPVATEDNLVGKTIVATAYGVGDQDPYPAAQILLVGDSMSDIPPVEVALPQGGDVVDDEARSTIEAILAVLSANGLTVA